MKINTTLLVMLKGTDLVASTAYLALVGKMGYTEKLLGIKRFDYFGFLLQDAKDSPLDTIETLKKVLDRQSTFYNRNKHLYSLECGWDGNSHREGLTSREIEKRWTAELRNSLSNKDDTDLVGNESRKPVIFNELSGFLVEILVEDDDRSSRDSIAAKLQSDLGGVDVSCVNRATLWWLVLCARNEEEARALADEIVVTRRRDRGLLLNPNYQHAEVKSVRAIEQV